MKLKKTTLLVLILTMLMIIPVNAYAAISSPITSSYFYDEPQFYQKTEFEDEYMNWIKDTAGYKYIVRMEYSNTNGSKNISYAYGNSPIVEVKSNGFETDNSNPKYSLSSSGEKFRYRAVAVTAIEKSMSAFFVDPAASYSVWEMNALQVKSKAYKMQYVLYNGEYLGAWSGLNPPKAPSFDAELFNFKGVVHGNIIDLTWDMPAYVPHMEITISGMMNTAPIGDPPKLEYKTWVGANNGGAEQGKTNWTGWFQYDTEYIISIQPTELPTWDSDIGWISGKPLSSVTSTLTLRTDVGDVPYEDPYNPYTDDPNSEAVKKLYTADEIKWFSQMIAEGKEAGRKTYIYKFHIPKANYGSTEDISKLPKEPSNINVLARYIVVNTTMGASYYPDPSNNWNAFIRAEIEGGYVLKLHDYNFQEIKKTPDNYTAGGNKRFGYQNLETKYAYKPFYRFEDVVNADRYVTIENHSTSIPLDTWDKFKQKLPIFFAITDGFLDMSLMDLNTYKKLDIQWHGHNIIPYDFLEKTLVDTKSFGSFTIIDLVKFLLRMQIWIVFFAWMVNRFKPQITID